MPNIFISYRREDSRHATGRIADRLASHFGEDRVFIDIETIPLGIDFRKYVTDQLEKCEIVLAIMGDDWLCDENGPSENTRIELATALERGDLPIIPILVGEAPVPGEDQLPDDLKALSYRNGLKLHGDRGFNQGMQSLIEVIERETEWKPVESDGSDNGEQPSKRKPGTRGIILSAIAAILAAAGSYYFVFYNRGLDITPIDITQGPTEMLRLNPGQMRTFEFVPESSGMYEIAVISQPNHVDQGWFLYLPGTNVPLEECDTDHPERGTETCETELEGGRLYQLDVENLTGDQVEEPKESVYFTITVEKLPGQ